MTAVMTTTASSARKRRVFDSVFKPAIPHSEPTPEIRSTGYGESFGGPIRDPSNDPLRSPGLAKLGAHSIASAEVRWDRAWHTVTSYLAALHASDDFVLDEHGHLTKTPPLPEPKADFSQALKEVIEWNVHVPYSTTREDLMVWYSQRMRSHFLQRVLPDISQISRQNETESVLQNTVEVLARAHRLYHYGISLLVRQLDISTPGVSRSTVRQFRREIHAVVSNAISERHWAAIKTTLTSYTAAILQISKKHDEPQPPPTSVGRRAGEADVDAARAELFSIVDSLCNVGLGGEKFQISFSEVMNEAMTAHVNLTYAGVWSIAQDESLFQGASISRRRAAGSSFEDMSLLPQVVNQSSQSRCVLELCDWIENQYARLAVEVLAKLSTADVAWNDLEKWKEMSVGRLAALRIRELFNIVVSWPNSNGALDDLRAAVTTPQRRLQLTDAFSATLKERLLHPGASTLQILRTYISMIWSFHYLDQSKVLLDRVAYPLQEYLCSREDTVRIIIAGLLSDTEDSEGNTVKPGGEKLVELAILLNQGSDQMGQRSDDLLDWDDMDWMPDPVDAGPGYKRSKNADIIGTLIGVLGSQDVFIKEFQNIVAENLLKHEDDFEKELKLLELLKSRFGEAPLQSCEVMVRDILTSRQVNHQIRHAQNLDPSPEEILAARTAPKMLKVEHVSAEGLQKPSLNAKILSRLFWPQLHDETYRVPSEISALQARYESGFEALKNARKLTWLPALGQATVELDLEDRVVSEEVHTWQATVIWAFQSEDKGLSRTVEELVETLEMDETLVRSALKFWVGKMVLQETSTDRFIVLETLNKEDRIRSANAQAATAGNTATDNSVDEGALMGSSGSAQGGAAGGILGGKDKEEMYWQFIQGMLKNSAAKMPLAQIGMMLKMLIVEGFPYGNDELREFLGAKVESAELEMVGGKYRLKK